MKSVFRELYCGELYPAENIYSTSEEYKNIMLKMEKAEKDFVKGLTEGQADEFERVKQCLNDEASYGQEKAFIYGMRLGIRFMAEALSVD